TLAYSPDGQSIASASLNETYIWDIQTGENLEIPNHSGMNTLQYSLNGQHLLINYPGDTNSTGGVIVLDIATGDMIHNIPHDSYDVSYSPDGAYIASGGDGLRIWDALTGEEVHVFPSESFINNIAYSPDGQYIATTSTEVIQIWDVQTGEVIQGITHREDYIHDIMYSPDGRYLIYNDWLTLFAIWDTQIATEIQTLTNDLHHNTTAIFSPDGQYI
ncbi:MAG TPA: hypothetical protein PLZ51_29225, partial [Aggregatilineales bacterium]|nr:hypothetical protein [Aggregatilineales bacterium]